MSFQTDDITSTINAKRQRLVNYQLAFYKKVQDVYLFTNLKK